MEGRDGTGVDRVCRGETLIELRGVGRRNLKGRMGWESRVMVSFCRRVAKVGEAAFAEDAFLGGHGAWVL